jgi:hypothetical protein
MLNKCANSSCTEVFRYFGQGRLFRLEADPASRSYTSHPETVQEEYFWLCPECAKAWTLHLEDGGRIATVPLAGDPGTASNEEMPVISRSDGMLLRSVSPVRSRLK